MFEDPFETQRRIKSSLVTAAAQLIKAAHSAMWWFPLAMVGFTVAFVVLTSTSCSALASLLSKLLTETPPPKFRKTNQELAANPVRYALRILTLILLFLAFTLAQWLADMNRCLGKALLLATELIYGDGYPNVDYPGTRLKVVKRFCYLSFIMFMRPIQHCLWVLAVKWMVRKHRLVGRAEDLVKTGTPQLPTEVVSMILAHVKSSDLVETAAVNRLWQKASYQKLYYAPQLNGAHQFGNFMEMVFTTAAFLIRKHEGIQHIRKMIVYGGVKILPEYYAMVYPVTKQLQSLHFRNMCGPLAPHIPILCKRAAHVTDLGFRRCTLEDDWLSSLSAHIPFVTRLEITRVCASRTSIIKFLKTCVHLQHLKMDGYNVRILSNDPLLPFILKTFAKQLETLAFRLGPADWQTLDIPSNLRMTALKKVDVLGENSSTDEAFIVNFVKKSPHTTSWRLANCKVSLNIISDMASSDGHSDHPFQIPIQRLRLETTQYGPLSLSPSTHTRSPNEPLKRMTEFALWRCHSLRDEALVSLVTFFPSLTILDVQGCNHVTDAGLCHIGKLCPKLETLNVSACFALTDVFLFSLASAKVCLKEFMAFGCHALTLNGLEHLCREVPTLLRLGVCNNGFPHWEAVEQLLKGGNHICLRGNIRHHSFHGVGLPPPRFSQIDWELFLTRYPSLRPVHDMMDEDEIWWNRQLAHLSRTYPKSTLVDLFTNVTCNL